LGLGCLAVLVLLDAFLLQALETERTTNHLLAGTNCLVPGALSAVGIILSNGAIRGRREWAELGGCVRRIVFELCLIFVLIGLGLKRSLVGLQCAVVWWSLSEELTWSADFPVTAAIPDCTAPFAESTTDWRVEVLS